MEFTVLNISFEPVYLLETYESMVWIDKFSEPGTFELTSPIYEDLLTYLKPDYYITNSESEHVMIIEDRSIESSATEGGQIKVVGRSLESILDRRVVSSETNVSGSLQSCIKTIINNNFISPSNTDRRMSGFIFADSTDTAITSLTMDHQFHYENVLEVVSNACAAAKIGFKITLDDSNNFVFKLYTGTDKSYDSSSDVFVIFSPEFDNLLSSTYVEKHSTLKTIVLSKGSENDSSAQWAGQGTGFERKETFFRSNVTKGSLSTTNYNKKLVSAGKDELARIRKESVYFDGECDTTRMYKYGVDFFLGDYVQMEDSYGHGGKTRVTEFTWSHTTSGLETYPTFTKDDED